MRQLTERRRAEILALSNKRLQIEALVSELPGLSSAEMAAKLEFGQKVVSAILSQINGKSVHRARVKDQATNIPYYIYYPGAAESTEAPKPADLAGAASQDEKSQNADLSEKESEPAKKSVIEHQRTAERAPADEKARASEVFDVIETAHVDAAGPEDYAPPGSAPLPQDEMNLAASVSEVRNAPDERGEEANPHAFRDIIEERLTRLPDVGHAIDSLAAQFAHSIASAIADRIIDSMSSKLSELMPNLISEKLEKRMADVIAEQEAMAEELPDRVNREDRKSVLIVGVLPDQSNMIETEFSDVFRIRSWKKGAGRQLKEMAASSDYVVTFTSKMSHAEEDCIKSAGKKPIRVSGGMTRLRDALTQLYVDHSAE